ncbi:hypothetical protein E4U13_004566 [Claviceps humidiphila]|uniref:Uncharacterized protein n=2 Tax=Claviceps TaxID=5110 RepID=A0A9P7Q6U7_9HYPO|nr:hypothetical protein E4U57_002896 [Claviceps arundinis]KAG6121518.1 hypothetical protein E4U13_004566 [Claviceps humidiphila]
MGVAPAAMVPIHAAARNQMRRRRAPPLRVSEPRREYYCTDLLPLDEKDFWPLKSAYEGGDAFASNEAEL